VPSKSTYVDEQKQRFFVIKYIDNQSTSTIIVLKCKQFQYCASNKFNKFKIVSKAESCGGKIETIGFNLKRGKETCAQKYIQDNLLKRRTFVDRGFCCAIIEI
jgi:hypothetical protein